MPASANQQDAENCLAQEAEKKAQELQKKAGKIPEFEAMLRSATHSHDDLRHRSQQLVDERQGFIDKNNALLATFGQHKVQARIAADFGVRACIGQD